MAFVAGCVGAGQPQDAQSKQSDISGSPSDILARFVLGQTHHCGVIFEVPARIDAAGVDKLTIRPVDPPHDGWHAFDVAPESGDSETRYVAYKGLPHGVPVDNDLSEAQALTDPINVVHEIYLVKGENEVRMGDFDCHPTNASCTSQSGWCRPAYYFDCDFTNEECTEKAKIEIDGQPLVRVPPNWQSP